RHVGAIRWMRLDVIAFLVTVVFGVFTYGALHAALREHRAVVTCAMVAVMLAYAAIVVSVPRLRLRLDQAGDNAYYLGLLLTLTSMAFALYDFGTAVGGTEVTRGPRAGAQQIIANFGVALATTITGIFLRVFLQQMRVDPGEVESMTRVELAEASKRVR